MAYISLQCPIRVPTPHWDYNVFTFCGLFASGQYDRCTRKLLARCQDGENVWQTSSSMLGSTTDSTSWSSVEYAGDEEDEIPIIPSSAVSSTLKNLVEPKAISDIVSVLFSHRQLSQKNKLIILVIEWLMDRQELGIVCDLEASLKTLTELSATGNSKVALSARRLLISLQTPSYEVRRNQVSPFLLSSSSSSSPLTSCYRSL